MLGMFPTEKIQLHRNLVGEQPSPARLWFWGPILEARLKSWPTAIAHLEMTATKADPDSPSLLL